MTDSEQRADLPAPVSDEALDKFIEECDAIWRATSGGKLNMQLRSIAHELKSRRGSLSARLEIEQLRDEIERLRRSISPSAVPEEVREAALEEAARVGDAKAAHWKRMREIEPKVQLHRGYEIAEEAFEEYAEAIRALILSAPSAGRVGEGRPIESASGPRYRTERRP